MMSDGITLAVSKGRILEEALPLLERAGCGPLDDPGRSRRLVLPTGDPNIRLVIVRAADVPVYVAHGGADLGVAGRDVLMEYEGGNLYEPLDLGIARCRMVLAGPRDAPRVNGRLRVATKYAAATRDYFAGQGRQVELIKLYGSMELAPVLGLADRIVDLVNTGKTLEENNLVPLDDIAEISARLIVNRAAMKMKRGLIKPVMERLAAAAGA